MRELWQQIQSSVFSLTFENAEGRISSGSGFKVGDYLVTNNHVIQVPDATRVVIRGVQQDGHTTSMNISYDCTHFRTFLVDGDPEASWDYAILRIPDPAFLALPSLQIEQENAAMIGAKIAIFGYQFEQPQLSMHVGYISSQFVKVGVNYIQLDSSVNNGNSGGPLIDESTGRVIGIVTRKATGLTQQFDELLRGFRQNIGELLQLQQRGQRGLIGGLDPVQTALVIQSQMEQIAREIGRSANVGIGYAYHIRRVRQNIPILL